MKFLVLLAVVAYVSAEGVKYDESAASIVKSSFDSSPEGNSFSYGFESNNGIISQAEGVVKNPSGENPALEVKGSVKYNAPDGTPVELVYVANENGYQASGSHIPVPPPIPELILRSLQYIAEHPAPVERVVKKN
ncbi:larval cuticle protein LCP-17-like [Danaus plexippus]|uniref:Cuticular protein CPR2 n=1 Tax=Danaus plexippus plexippus TaxID=278856 RepID=A0A212FIE2_DANPL|nr:larval cuticle protein LCP-17-like [Danaus plexippus]OWR53495.1 cuticular protein CPR2 [Danaus plexippus plexippus]